MGLESLLLSQDADVVRVIRPTLEKLSIEVEVCQEAKKASEILISEKFDAVIVDCDDLKGGLELLECLRSTPSNKNSVTFALLNGKKTTTQEAFSMGVNFVLQKPISTLNAARCFHAALSFMERERRRYYRQPVKMPVTIILGDQKIRATSTNISEGGMAIMLHQALPKGATPRLQFTLPESKLSLDVETEVAWADIKGHLGLRFQNIPQSSQELLEKWLSQQMEQLSGSREKSAGSIPEPIQ
ncbi:MAG TPA: response regulator [Candidatus Acidoferrum sp.]|jgi:CheY-like chemotaxis protein|nr:response regulator [Candidatus Acidoferrum sp.]